MGVRQSLLLPVISALGLLACADGQAHPLSDSTTNAPSDSGSTPPVAPPAALQSLGLLTLSVQSSASDLSASGRVAVIRMSVDGASVVVATAAAIHNSDSAAESPSAVVVLPEDDYDGLEIGLESVGSPGTLPRSFRAIEMPQLHVYAGYVSHVDVTLTLEHLSSGGFVVSTGIARPGAEPPAPIPESIAVAATVVGIAGGRVVSDGLLLDIPADALDGPTLIGAIVFDSVNVYGGPAVELLPEGLNLRLSATATLGYDPRRIPAFGSASESELRLSHSGQLVNSTLDPVASTLTAQLSHFSDLSATSAPGTCRTYAGITICRRVDRVDFEIADLTQVRPQIIHGASTDSPDGSDGPVHFRTISDLAAAATNASLGEEGIPVLVLSTVESDRIGDDGSTWLGDCAWWDSCRGYPSRTLITPFRQWIGGCDAADGEHDCGRPLSCYDMVGGQGQTFFALDSHDGRAAVNPFRAGGVGTAPDDATVASQCLIACDSGLSASALSNCATRLFPVAPSGFDLFLGSGSTILWDGLYRNPCLACADAVSPPDDLLRDDCYHSTGSLTTCRGPRMAVGTSDDGRRVVGLATDVRLYGAIGDRRYGRGLSASETAGVLASLDATRAVLLDGGHAVSAWFRGESVLQYDAPHVVLYGSQPRILAALAFYPRVSLPCPAGMDEQWRCDSTAEELRSCVRGVIHTQRCEAGCLDGLDQCVDSACPPGLSADWSCAADGRSHIRCVDRRFERSACSSGCDSSTGACRSSGLPACPAGTWPIWTCDAGLSERVRCGGGGVEREACLSGCSRRPAGIDDVCCAPTCDGRCGGAPDGCGGRCEAACPDHVEVVAPNGGEALPVGRSSQIRWRSIGSTAFLRVHLRERSTVVATSCSAGRCSAASTHRRTVASDTCRSRPTSPPRSAP